MQRVEPDERDTEHRYLRLQAGYLPTRMKNKIRIEAVDKLMITFIH